MPTQTTAKGHTFVISDEDADLIERRWKTVISRGGRPYIHRSHPQSEYLHRVIAVRMGHALDGLTVDHINGDTLDNRRCNLRVVPQAVNSRNLGGRRANNTSGIQGVRWIESRQRWNAQIKTDYRAKNLGNFKTKEEAIAARLQAERELWGIQPRREQAHAA